VVRRALTCVGVLAALAIAATAHGEPAPAHGAQAPAHAPGRSTTYIAEEIATGPLPHEILQKMEPLHTLVAVENLLKANRIPFAWRIGEIATAKMPPELAAVIAKLPPGEVFIIPQQNAILIAVILSARRE
jgi:hypothetical protein